MTLDNRNELLRLLQRHKDLGISDQIDYEKFYLYSIITHSTAIEGSTVTEVEAQLLFDEGITSMQNDIDQFIKSSDKKMVDKEDLHRKMVDKWSIKPSLAKKMVDILSFIDDKDTITTDILVQHFGFAPTTAKRYLRQLTEFGYLKAQGGNKNRTYLKIL